MYPLWRCKSALTHAKLFSNNPNPNLWAPTDMGKGQLPSPGKVEKCYRVKKNSISEVSFNSLDAIGLGVCLGLEAKILPYTQEIMGKNRSRQWSSTG